MCACKYNGRKMASQKREMTLVDHGEQRNKFSLCNAHSPQGNGEWIASFLIRSKRVWNVYPISIYRYIRIVHAEKSLLSIRLGENKRRAISRCFLYRSHRTVSEIWSSIHQILRSIPYPPPPLFCTFYFRLSVSGAQFRWFSTAFGLARILCGFLLFSFLLLTPSYVIRLRCSMYSTLPATVSHSCCWLALTSQTY